jgi:O-methyltransferase involved in polyketide biosynthesis
MSEVTAQSLSGVAETLLITLAIRAFESQRPDEGGQHVREH